MITIKEWLVNVVQLNKINVVGLGPGNIKYLSTSGMDCIKEAEIIIGSTRQLSDLKTIISEKQEIYKAAFHEMFDTINKDINSLPSVK